MIQNGIQYMQKGCVMKIRLVWLMLGVGFFAANAMDDVRMRIESQPEAPERSSSDTVLEKRKQMSRSATMSTIVLKKSKPVAQVGAARSAKIEKRSTSPRPIPRSKSMAIPQKESHVPEDKYNEMHSPQHRIKKRAAEVVAAHHASLSSSPSSSGSHDDDNQEDDAESPQAGN